MIIYVNSLILLILISKGLRQVAKTESITRFGHQNYKSVVYINFVEEPNYKMINVSI